MPYLLDTQVVSYFLQARREAALAEAAEITPCVIAEIVRDELSEDATRGALFDRWLPTSHLGVISIAVGSPAEALWKRLQPRVTQRGRGERASIALAATHGDHVFTGMDKGGMWLALRELWGPGERLISLPVFLRRLVDGNALAGDAADDVMRRSNQHLPT